jgi:uncharacterized protein YkwD/uncharacterized membrane protein required for colicin V production
LNLVDLLWVGFVAFFVYRGYRRGLVAEALDLAGVLLGVVAALRLYPFLGAVFRLVGFGRGIANGVAGMLIFAGFMVGATLLARRVHRRMGAARFADPLRTGGAVLAAAWASLLGAFLIVLVTVVPSPGIVQRAVPRSLIGRTALGPSSPVYTALDSFARNEARNLVFYVRQYLARFEPKPEPKEAHDCFDIQPSSDIAIDAEAEKRLTAMANAERAGRGLSPLRSDVRVRTVARQHSADMYRKGYFCHVGKDGRDPFERLDEGKIDFERAGENLALAPTIEMVHRGLMNSPKHKENILRRQFTDIGIGVYKGPYGLMVTQNFCGNCR